MSYPTDSKASYGAAGGAYPSQAPPYPSHVPPYPSQAPPYPPPTQPYPASGPPYPGYGEKGPLPPAPGGGPMDSYPPHSQAPYQGPQGEDHPEPSCPPPEDMPSVSGYGNVGFEAAMVPPPAYETVVGERPEREVFKSSVTITDEDAREAILEHATNECCWGKGPARDMVINDLNLSSAYHYTLETFGESRSTKWDSKPFFGGNVVVSGPIPGPWDIQVNVPELFRTTKLDVEVPNSANVKPCYKCRGRGSHRCPLCSGSGRRACTWCNGRGTRETYEGGQLRRTPCSCRGGYDFCGSCNGTGRRECNKCQGRAHLRWFILLTIQWTNHVDHHIEQRTPLPGELIKDVTGEVAFEEVYPRVWPITTFPVAQVNTSSNELIRIHSSKFLSEKIHMQRQRVQCVPVTEAHYNYKDKLGTFIVYGLEKKVYAPDYPAQCCCGCSIL